MSAVVGAVWQWGGGFGGVVGGGQVVRVSGSVVGACFEVGWLPVARVEAGVRQGVRDKARVRVLERLGAYGWALGERYRIEQVFGRVKGVYGSYVGCRCWGYARVWVWGMLVLWNLVPWLRVGGDGGDCLCVVFVVWGG